nr:hemerythrin domain-containing protein [Nocardiopsis algeriensis]
MITREHREMERMFQRLETNRAERSHVLGKVETMFLAHSRAEEEEVYPVIAREAGEKEEAHHGAEEHHEAERLLARLKECDPDSEEFDQRLKEFVDAVNHHVEEEESDVLPALKQVADDARLRELGRVFEERRAQEIRAHEQRIAQQAPDQQLYAEAREAGFEDLSELDPKDLPGAVDEARRELD